MVTELGSNPELVMSTVTVFGFALPGITELPVPGLENMPLKKTPTTTIPTTAKTIAKKPCDFILTLLEIAQNHL